MTKNWFKSKQFWAGVATIVTGISEFVAGLPPEAGTATIILGIVAIVIRFFTNTAISGTPGAKAK